MESDYFFQQSLASQPILVFLSLSSSSAFIMKVWKNMFKRWKYAESRHLDNLHLKKQNKTKHADIDFKVIKTKLFNFPVVY